MQILPRRNIEVRRRAAGRFDHDSMHPKLRQIYAARQVVSEDDIDYRLECLLTPQDLPGVDDAVEVLESKLRNNARILFIGDFDADGATSSALGILALKAMGADHVGYLVPNRFDHGYGLSPEIVRIADQMRPDLLITVDNGIANVEGVEVANSLGTPVIITDHHLPGERLPEAVAIVNPNLHGSAFSSRSLAGVGVIFYVMVALRSHLRKRGWFATRPQPNLGALLDLVAIGTVADVVPLDKNNRILVANGLDRINMGRTRPGIAALLGFCHSRTGEITSSDLGFVVAPRLNAAGRLQDMSLGIECLLTDNQRQASRMARELDQLNKQRREIESDMKTQAMEVIDKLQMSGDIEPGVCLYDKHWHQGIVGLIASRIKERIGKPVIAFARANGRELKGSGRSIPGLHIRDVLNGIHTRYPDLIIRFGGHAAAAGLSLKEENFPRFVEAFSQEVRLHLHDDGEGDVIYSDGGLHDRDLSLDFASLLKKSGPWGQQFPEPVFDDEFEVLDSRVVGHEHLKLTVRKREGGKVVDAIAFYHDKNWQRDDMKDGVRLVYRLDINEYQGVRKPQLIVQHLALLPGAA